MDTPVLDSGMNIMNHLKLKNVYEIKYLSILTDSSDDLPRSACKRPKLDVTLEEWDLSGLPWWFLGNLRSNYTRRSNGSTDIHTNQVRGQAPLKIIHMAVFLLMKKNFIVVSVVKLSHN